MATLGELGVWGLRDSLRGSDFSLIEGNSGRSGEVFCSVVDFVVPVSLLFNAELRA